jgi:8-oxo-dGTP diphosphatase
VTGVLMPALPLDVGQDVARADPRCPCLAVSIAVLRSGKVLLATRTKPPYAGAFSLPGGRVEPGETLVEAALRELHEEVGVDARVIGFNQHVELIDRDANGALKHHYVIASFTGEWISGEGTPGPEAGKVIWADPSEIARLDYTPNIPGIVEAAIKMLQIRDQLGS